MNLEQIIAEIVREQSLIIGERLAKSRAEMTGVIKFKTNNIDELILTTSEINSILPRIINSYADVFGQASIQVCIEVLKKHHATEAINQLPENFKIYF